MELLLSFGVSTELQKDEFVGKLKCGCSADQVRTLRDYLFEDTLKLNLTSDGDCLVIHLALLLVSELLIARLLFERGVYSNVS